MKVIISSQNPRHFLNHLHKTSFNGPINVFPETGIEGCNSRIIDRVADGFLLISLYLFDENGGAYELSFGPVSLIMN